MATPYICSEESGSLGTVGYTDHALHAGMTVWMSCYWAVGDHHRVKLNLRLVYLEAKMPRWIKSGPSLACVVTAEIVHGCRCS